MSLSAVKKQNGVMQVKGHRMLVGIAVMLLSGAAAAQTPSKPEPVPPPGAARSNPVPVPRTFFIQTMDTEFRQMDADKNGQLTRVEIEQFQKLQVLANAQARNRGLFARLDADRSGQLSPDEFAKLVQPPPAANAQPMLTRMDGNHDNQISVIEYRSATLANFDRLDTDKDGVVSPAEMKAGGIVR